MNPDLPIEPPVVYAVLGVPARLEIVMNILMALMLGGLMLMTFIDVIGRYLFNAPVPAAYEITELVMGIILFGSLASVTGHRKHIAVDLIDPYVRGQADAIRRFLTDVISTAVLSIFTWQIWARASQAASDHAQTQLLGVAVAPFIYAIALLAGIALITQAALLFSTSRRALVSALGG